MTFSGYKVIEHTADWALQITGADFGQLLTYAAQGMSTLLVGNLSEVSLSEERLLVLDAFDAEGLLVEWLSELAYLAEMSQLVFSQYTILELTQTHLQVLVHGGVAPKLHKHITAITYHDLAIIETAVGLQATIVFDV